MPLAGRERGDDRPEFAGRRGHRVGSISPEDPTLEITAASPASGVVERDPVDPARRRAHPTDSVPPLERPSERLVGRLRRQRHVAERVSDRRMQPGVELPIPALEVVGPEGLGVPHHHPLKS